MFLYQILLGIRQIRRGFFGTSSFRELVWQFLCAALLVIGGIVFIAFIFKTILGKPLDINLIVFSCLLFIFVGLLNAIKDLIFNSTPSIIKQEKFVTYCGKLAEDIVHTLENFDLNRYQDDDYFKEIFHKTIWGDNQDSPETLLEHVREIILAEPSLSLAIHKSTMFKSSNLTGMKNFLYSFFYFQIPVKITDYLNGFNSLNFQQRFFQYVFRKEVVRGQEISEPIPYSDFDCYENARNSKQLTKLLKDYGITLEEFITSRFQAIVSKILDAYFDIICSKLNSSYPFLLLDGHFMSYRIRGQERKWLSFNSQIKELYKDGYKQNPHLFYDHDVLNAYSRGNLNLVITSDLDSSNSRCHRFCWNSLFYTYEPCNGVKEFTPLRNIHVPSEEELTKMPQEEIPEVSSFS